MFCTHCQHSYSDRGRRWHASESRPGGGFVISPWVWGSGGPWNGWLMSAHIHVTHTLLTLHSSVCKVCCATHKREPFSPCCGKCVWFYLPCTFVSINWWLHHDSLGLLRSLSWLPFPNYVSFNQQQRYRDLMRPNNETDSYILQTNLNSEVQHLII